MLQSWGRLPSRPLFWNISNLLVSLRFSQCLCSPLWLKPCRGWHIIFPVYLGSITHMQSILIAFPRIKGAAEMSLGPLRYIAIARLCGFVWALCSWRAFKAVQRYSLPKGQSGVWVNGTTVWHRELQCKTVLEFECGWRFWNLLLETV